MNGPSRRQKFINEPTIKGFGALVNAIKENFAVRLLVDTFTQGLPVALLGIGILLIILGALPDDGAIWGRALMAIGSAMVAGGIFSVVLKSLQFRGVYHDVLTEILYDPKHLRLRNDLNDIWSRVTTLISQERFSELYAEMHKTVLEKYLPTKTDFYYERYNRTCVIDWKNKETTEIVLKEELELDIVPTSSDALITYKFESRPSEGVPLAINCPTFELLEINGKAYFKDGKLTDPKDPSLSVEKDQCKDGEIFKIKITLKGESKYRVRRRTSRTFPIGADPYQRYTSERFINGAKINVQCIPDDLRVRFVSLGTPNDFESFAPKEIGHQSRMGDINMEYQGLLFPQQGYLLVFHALEKRVLDAFVLAPPLEEKQPETPRP